MRVWLWVPLAAFVLLFSVFAVSLYRPDDRTHPSKLIGKPMPSFSLPPAAEGRPGFTSGDFRSGPRLVNVFASWCVPCATEAPLLGGQSGE